jgi:rubredoxin
VKTPPDQLIVPLALGPYPRPTTFFLICIGFSPFMGRVDRSPLPTGPLRLYSLFIMANTQKLKRYRCLVCEHIYDPAVGDPDSGVAPGTPFESLPDTWICPDCGASKFDFEPIAD